ncbi:MAG: acyl carrier protein [Polyangiaceae bacterium]|nr:acyl carrier protein [Polyangiaceae bacterium]
MGLGLVELVFATEEHFGISIPDEDLRGTTTVGALAALVVRLSEKKGGDAPSCRTSRAFYRLRRALVRASGVG